MSRKISTLTIPIRVGKQSVCMADEATPAGDARQRRYARPLAGTGSAPLRRQRREQFRSGELAPSSVGIGSPSDNQGVVEGGQTVVGACLEERRQWAPAFPATTRSATDRSRQQFNRRQIAPMIEATGNHNRAVGQDRGCAG